jgi:ParB family transcriptional regulator, chromosome partitioning protein
VTKKRGLGRGLDALLGIDSSAGSIAVSAAQSLGEIDMDEIFPGQYQPRRNIGEEGLQELAASIRAQGVMQPIVLRRRASGGYEIIAGERRWRAARLAGLTRIPALIKDVSDERAVAMALIENIQREDLNPLEEALALQRLQEEFQLTQQQVADAVGKSRVAVTNLLRLINLSAPVKAMLGNGELEMGHARALLALSAHQQEEAARSVVARGLSVRQTEALVRKLQEPAVLVPMVAPRKDPDTVRLERELSDRIGAPVAITFDAKRGGSVVIRYGNIDELEGILKHLR